MAGLIKGITIEFGANTQKLNKALGGVQGQLNKTNSELKQIDRALKFNPGSTTLLKQKFELLSKSVQQTEDKLKQLRTMQSNMDANGVDKNSAQYRQLQREIIKTEDQLKQAKNQLRSFGSVGKQQVMAVGNSFKTAGSKITSVGRSITSTMSVFGTAGIYAGAKLIEMSEKQAQAEQKLTEIYKTRMGVGKQAVQSTLDLASAQQKVGVVGDEVQIAAAQQLATYAQTPGAVNKMLPALNDLLVQQKGLNGTQEDAVGLANLFGKAMMGQTGALKKAGISFTAAQEEVLKYGTEEEKAATIAEVVNQNVGDMNEQFAKTDAGKIQQAKNAIGDMGEEIGAILLPAVADLVSWFQDNLLPKIQQLIDYMKEHPAIAKFALAFMGIMAVLGPVIMVIGSLISAIGTIITIAPMLGGAFSALLGPVGIVIAAIAAAIAIGVALYKNWDTIKAKLTAFKNFMVSVFNAIKTKVVTIFKAVKEAITKPIQAAVDFVKKMISKIKEFFKFKVSLPHIKLPHFGIKPKGWKLGDLLKGVIPTLGINWYAKGGIFNSPSVIGVGEAGAEAVIPIDKLNAMMNASNSQMISALVTALSTQAMNGGGEYKFVINLGGANVATQIFKLNKQGQMILEA